ncbi:MAG TPA: hypothetical protein VFS21_39650 [Roseiflexaceae bacterium]|nr:hypothetical protein [Roseiflexaceae bacterium]
MTRLQSIALFALLLLAICLPAAAQTTSAPVYLPIVSGPPVPLSPFGMDLRAYTSQSALDFAMSANPKWVRAGDALWSDVEPVRGGGYRWEALATLEANIRRIRAANPNVEPTVVVQRSPAWAQSISGRLCSPPKREYVADFARFLEALSRRFSASDLRVNYYEIWNEPDVAPEDTSDDMGMGCWMNKSAPRQSGFYYGEVLSYVAPWVKNSNPNATVIGGALLYNWPDDVLSRAFLEGMLDSGAGKAVDAISFHAYGEWGATDLLVNKTLRLRGILAAYGLDHKPLFATEVAALCLGLSQSSCSPSFEQWKFRQANYAARIYAQALALDLQGAFWFTLVSPKPGFYFSHLIDEDNGTLTPREAYNSFLNSATLLQGARYVGQPITMLPGTQPNAVRDLVFRKPRSVWDPSRGSMMHVLWQQQFDATPLSHPIEVPPGSSAVCYTRLDLQNWVRFDCSDNNADGRIWFGVIDFPQYIEVIDK